MCFGFVRQQVDYVRIQFRRVKHSQRRFGDRFENAIFNGHFTDILRKILVTKTLLSLRQLHSFSLWRPSGLKRSSSTTSEVTWVCTDKSDASSDIGSSSEPDAWSKYSDHESLILWSDTLCRSRSCPSMSEKSESGWCISTLGLGILSPSSPDRSPSWFPSTSNKISLSEKPFMDSDSVSCLPRLWGDLGHVS